MARYHASLWLTACLAAALPCAARDPQPALKRIGVVMGKDAARGHTARVSAVAFSPDGKTLATGSWDNTVRLWDVATGQERRRMPGHEACIYYVAFSPDGKLLASGSRDRTVRLWDPATGEPVRQLRGHTRDVFGVAFSPDGKTLASGGEDKFLRLWDVATGKLLRTGESQDCDITTVVFAPDGKTLVTGSHAGNVCRAGTLTRWDAATGKVLRHFTGHVGWVYPIALSSDGKTLVSGGHDATIRFWEVATGTQRRQLDNQGGEVFALALSPDGRTLASAGQVDNVVRLWEVSSGRLRGRLEGHQGPTFRLAFAPDGKTLASGSDDHTAILWDLTRLPGPAAPTAQVPAASELDALWDDLASPDAERGYRAVLRLAAAPRQAVPFLAGRLRPRPDGEAQQIARLIAELDDESFKVRERAAARLEKLGGQAVPELRRAVRETKSAEVRRRAQRLLEGLTVGAMSTDELQRLRVVEVLEQAGTAEAERVLKALAASAPPGEAEEAKAALGRLERRRGDR
jgi:tricorn protease-like protein